MAAQAPGHLPGAIEVARKHRVDLVLVGLGQGTGQLGADGGQQPAGAAVAGVGAQPDRALREVAAQPSGPPDQVALVDVGARQHLLHERAPERLLGLVAGLGHGHLGEGRHRGDVQVLPRGVVARAEQQHGAEILAAGDDRHLGGHLAGRVGRPPASLAAT